MADNTLSIPGNRGMTLIDILAETAIAGLSQRVRQGVKPGMAQQIGYGGTPPPGNIGNCQGQITVTYFVNDSPVVET